MMAQEIIPGKVRVRVAGRFDGLSAFDLENTRGKRMKQEETKHESPGCRGLR